MSREVFRVADATHGIAHQVESSAYKARVYLSADTIRQGQVHTLTLEMTINDGFHAQGALLPEGYIPLAVSVEDVEGVTVDPVDYPPSTPYRIAGLNNDLNVYVGNVTVQTRVLLNLREDVTLKVHLQAQVCTDSECLLPEHHTFEIPLNWLPNP